MLEENDSGAFTGALAIKGAAAVTESNDTLVSAGDLTEILLGSAAITEGNDTLAGVSALAIAAAAAMTEGNDTISSASTLRLVATVAITEGNDTLATTGGPIVELITKISEILVEKDTITLAEFTERLNKGAPVGFSKFRPYAVGDYRYEDAYYRVILRATTSDRAAISVLNLTVDVPDVLESGTEAIDIAGTAIVFTRAFYVAPTVTVTLKGGTTVATPRIVGAITTTGFTVELVDATETNVAGTVTWQAHGY